MSQRETGQSLNSGLQDSVSNTHNLIEEGLRRWDRDQYMVGTLSALWSVRLVNDTRHQTGKGKGSRGRGVGGGQKVYPCFSPRVETKSDHGGRGQSVTWWILITHHLTFLNSHSRNLDVNTQI